MFNIIGDIMINETSTTLFSGNINIEYGQFYIGPADEDDEDFFEPDEAFEGQENGICGAAQSGKLFFVTGIQNGTIAVQIDLHETEPAIEHSYEEVVEVSFTRGQASVSLLEWGESEGPDLGLQLGYYRVRYCIDGMEKDYDEDGDWEAPVPGQRHLIQIWSGAQDKDKVEKQTSDMASYWHKEWGSWE